MAFHAFFKSNPNVITSLCARSERAVTRLTSWLFLVTALAQVRNPGLLWVLLPDFVVPLVRQTQQQETERTLHAPGGDGPMEPALLMLWCCPGVRSSPSSCLYCPSFRVLGKSSNCLVFVSAFFKSGLQVTCLAPEILSRWVRFLDLVKEDTLGRSEWNGPRK